MDKNNIFHGDYAGRDLNVTNIIMFQDSEREFVVTHNANIKPVSYFTGRETELKELRQRIENGRKSVLVSGMGGIGKTHICRKLFEEYLAGYAEGGTGPFEHIGYIEYDGNMGSSLQSCLKFKRQDDSERNQEAAWRELEYLASDGKLLLFVDNVDKPISADPGLQMLKSIPGAVVLTSRQAYFGDEFEPYRIGFLSVDQCQEIYEKIRFEGTKGKVRAEEVQELKHVIENLVGRHTITVELLAHLARTKHWTVKRLREELEKEGFCLEFHRNGEIVNIQESYEVLYDLSGLTKAEQNILEAFSVFPYIPLVAEMCDEWLLADAGASEDDNILVGLYEKGWLQFDAEQEGYALHPVFAQFIYKKCKPQHNKHLELIEACQRRLKILKCGSTLECRYCISFAESIAEKLCFEKEMEKISFIAAIAQLLYYIAELKKAEELYAKILQIRIRLLGEDHPDTATSYYNLAIICKSQGKYKKAEELFEKDLQIRERLLGEDHPNTVVTYNNVADVCKSLGKYKRAEVLYEKSLQISERLLGADHPDVVEIYNNLAGIYESQGEYKRAEELYEKSLMINKRLQGEDNLDTAVIYNNLAAAYKSQGEYKKAEELYEKSLQINERLLGEDHLDTAVSYNNLAAVYESQGKYKKAEEFCEKSLRIRKRLLGEDHLDTVVGYNNLAAVYEDQGKHKKAEELYEKSLRIRERLLGEDHLDTATSYNNLAGVCKNQGKYKKAEELYEKSLQISERLLGEDHPNIAVGYNNLAAVYEDQGKYKKAEELYQRSLQIREKLQGEEHPDTAVGYNNLAILYFYQRKYELALCYFIKAYKVFINKLGFEHPATKSLYEDIMLTYTESNPKGSFKQWLENELNK